MFGINQAIMRPIEKLSGEEILKSIELIESLLGDENFTMNRQLFEKRLYDLQTVRKARGVK